jgi:hypothetical protein
MVEGTWSEIDYFDCEYYSQCGKKRGGCNFYFFSLERLICLVKFDVGHSQSQSSPLASGYLPNAASACAFLCVFDYCPDSRGGSHAYLL